MAIITNRLMNAILSIQMGIGDLFTTSQEATTLVEPADYALDDAVPLRVVSPNLLEGVPQDLRPKTSPGLGWLLPDKVSTSQRGPMN